MKFSSTILFALVLFFLSLGAPSNAASATLIPYIDEETGFSFQYPSYWILVKDVTSIIAIQDGSIDLIRQEDLTPGEKQSYKVMVHVDGSPKYISNVVFMARPFNPDASVKYSSSEDAVHATRLSFEDTMASGTYFLEEVYLGESHTFVYRRTVDAPKLDDKIRITYYLLASPTHAFMMVETVTQSRLEDSVYRDQFNQITQSFRVTANESAGSVSGLDWGAQKPGSENPGSDKALAGKIEIHENFDNNKFHWPTRGETKIQNSRYELDSRNGFPFTDTNVNLGEINFDFSYQGDVKFLDGDESAGYGLVFAYLDEDNYFAFLVNRGGRFMIFQEVNGQVREIVPWTASSYLEGTEHTLLVQGDYQTTNFNGEANRYVFAFNVDGNEVSRTEVNKVLSVVGRLGLFVSKGVYVAFDSLVSRNFLLDSVMTLDRQVF